MSRKPLAFFTEELSMNTPQSSTSTIVPRIVVAAQVVVAIDRATQAFSFVCCGSDNEDSCELVRSSFVAHVVANDLPPIHEVGTEANKWYLTYNESELPLQAFRSLTQASQFLTSYFAQLNFPVVQGEYQDALIVNGERCTKKHVGFTDFLAWKEQPRY